MAVRIIIVCLCIITLFTGVYLLWGTTDITEVVPANTAGLISLNNPIQLAIKLSDSEMARDFRRIKSLAPLFEIVDNINAHQNELGLVALVAPRIFVSIPEDIVSRIGSGAPVTTYVDLGRFARLAKLMQIKRVLARKFQVTNFAGHTVYINDGHATSIVGTFIVFGEESGVLDAVSAYKKRIPNLGQSGESTSMAMETMDPGADISLMITESKLFEPDSDLGFLDPRKLCDPKAFLASAGNIYLDFEGVRWEQTIVQQEGKLFLPHSMEKGAEFALPHFLSPDMFMGVALKVENPDELTGEVMDLLGGQGTRLVKALSKLLIGSFLKAVGPEIGYIIPIYHDKVPAIAMQIKDSELIAKSLEKMGQKPNPGLETLKVLLGEDALDLIADPVKLKTALSILPDDKKQMIQMLLPDVESMKAGLASEFQSTEFMGKTMYYSIINDFFILSEYEWVLKKLKENQNQDKVAPLLADAFSGVNTQGSILAIFNLMDFAMGANLLSGKDTKRILEQYNWNLAVSVKAGGSQTDIIGFLPLQVGLGRTAVKISSGAKAIYWALILFGIVLFLAALIGLAVVGRKLLLQ